MQLDTSSISSIKNNIKEQINTTTQSIESVEQAVNEINQQYSNKSCSFSDIEDIANKLLTSLPKLDHDKIREEISIMTVDVFEDPTTFQLSEAMAKVQMYKDRLTEIFSLVDKEYTIRKRIVEMLFDANQAVSKQSSADKRKGEAAIRWPVHLINYTVVEAFRNELNNIIGNMRSKSDMLSRQATILDMQIKLGEYRKQIGNAEEMTATDYKSGVTNMWNEIR